MNIGYSGVLMKAKIIFVSILMLMLIGCDVTETNSNLLIIKTDNSIYSSITRNEIELSVENNLDYSLFYICAGDVFLEEYEESNLINSWKVHGLSECLSQNEIKPNEKKVFDIFLSVIDYFDYSIKPLFNSDVNYRLRIELYRYNEDNQLVRENGYSPVFKINGEKGVFLTVDKQRYNVGELIKVTLEKRYEVTSSDVYLYHCNYESYPEVMHKKYNYWVNYSAHICLDIYLSGVMEMPNKVYENTISIDEPGTYKIFWRYGYNDEKYLANIATSNEFTVE